ncbi:MAG: prenyltransferase/squalene oxidase repeat-containing protein [Planctomycetota bacterium]
MKPLLLLLILLLAGGAPAPVAAQGCGGGDDDESVLEGDDEEESKLEEGLEEEEERDAAGHKVRRKDDGSDPGAPKLKRSLQERVNAAIEAGVEALKKLQRPDGSWGPITGVPYGDRSKPEFDAHFSGPTSFAVYTLSKCGVRKSDPAIKKGYRWLRKKYRKTQIWSGAGNSGQKKGAMGTYEVASLLLMLEAMHEKSAKLTGRHSRRTLQTDNPRKKPTRSRFPNDDWFWLHQATVYITNGKQGGRGLTFKGCQNPNGGWRYGQAKGDVDMSATQFALLGLRAASQAGYPVKPRVWKWALAGVREFQKSHGGFSYKKNMGWSASMDACALGSMIICKEQLELAGSIAPHWVDESIARAMKHHDTVFDVQPNKGTHDGGSYHYYYLYSVERIGDLTGRKEFGGKDWYVRGAEFLLAHQQADGRWVDSTCIKPRDTLGTCFALLFLKKATMPAVTLSEG